MNLIAALSLLTLVQLYGAAFSSRGILAVCGFDKSVTLLDPSKRYEVIQTFTELAGRVR